MQLLQVLAQISILSHGAIANDGLSDNAAFTAANTAAVKGDVVFVPEGTFNIETVINMKEGVHLYGEGPAKSIIKQLVDYDGQMVSMTGSAINEFKDSSMVGICLDGDDHAIRGGFVSGYSERVRVVNCTIKNLGASANPNFGATGVHFFYDCDHAEVINCTFDNIGYNPFDQWAAAVVITWYSDYSIVRDNRATRIGRGGYFQANYCDYSTIYNNTFADSPDVPGAANLSIESFFRCNYAVIQNNTTDHWISVGGGEQVAVRNNTISGSTVDTEDFGLEVAAECRYILVNNNTVSTGQVVGLSLSGPGADRHFMLFSNNTISGSATWLCQIADDNNKYILFHKNKFNQVLPNGNIHDWTPFDDTTAMRLFGNTYGITFQENTFSRNLGTASCVQTVFSTNERIFFKNNRFDTNGYLFNSRFSANLDITDSYFRGNSVVRTQQGSGYPLSTYDIASDEAKLAKISIQVNGVRKVNNTQTFKVVGDFSRGDVQDVLWDLGESYSRKGYNVNYYYQTAGTRQIQCVIFLKTGVCALKTMNLPIL